MVNSLYSYLTFSV